MKTISTLSLAIVLLLATVDQTLAYNRFFEDGQSGITGEIGGIFGEDVAGWAYGANVTVLGRVDLGVYSYSPENKDLTFIKWKETTGRLGISLLRPIGMRSWGMDIWGSYTDITTSGGSSGWLGGRGIGGGMDVYFDLNEGEDFNFHPVLGVGYVQTDFWTTMTPDGSRAEGTEEALLIGLELGITYMDSILLRPQMAILDGEAQWAITLGITWALGE